MHEQLEMMEEFHRAFGHPINQPELISLTVDNVKYIKLRTKLNTEECKELNTQLWNDVQSGKISPNLLKEGADLLYVLLGTFVSLGLGEQLIEAFKRVHESNMSKLGEDGKPLYREDGKVLKGPNYKPPELGDLI
jgi:predicted HAD superfamily Cof-like phosphohydrolase